MASHYPSSPGFQLNSSHLLQSQQEALSAASPNLQAAIFLIFPAIPRAVNIVHTDCAGKPLQPTSTGNSQVCHPLSLHYWSRSLFLVAFLSEASSQLSSHGTVGSIRIILFTSSDHMATSGLRDVWKTWENCSFLPRSTFISHDCAACRRLFLEEGGFSPSLINWIYEAGLTWVWRLFRLSCSKISASVVVPSISPLAKYSLEPHQYVRQCASPFT